MSQKVIAVVDDEPLIVDMLTTFLTVKGFMVRGVNSGEEGLTLVEVENPDLLILDLMMPDIEGFDVLVELRKTPPFDRLPILVLTARTDSRARERAMQCGADGFLTKPVKFPDLLIEIERLLAARK
ncbi:MAG: response regulator [Anaerolineae bacterium]|nr:response regulator [Anaerolineae bacterium]